MQSNNESNFQKIKAKKQPRKKYNKPQLVSRKQERKFVQQQKQVAFG